MSINPRPIQPSEGKRGSQLQAEGGVSPNRSDCGLECSRSVVATRRNGHPQWTSAMISANQRRIATAKRSPRHRKHAHGSQQSHWRERGDASRVSHRSARPRDPARVCAAAPGSLMFVERTQHHTAVVWSNRVCPPSTPTLYPGSGVRGQGSGLP